MLHPLLLVLCITITSCNTEVKRYDRHKVIRVTPKNVAEYQQVLRFETYLESMEIDIWRTCSSKRGSLDFRLAPDMTHILNDLDLQYEVLIHDIQPLMDDVAKTNKVKRDTDPLHFDYGKYHNLEEIEEWMKSMLIKYKNMTEMFPVAESFEGRHLSGLKISVDPLSDKPGIWLQSGLHAREWIAPATVIYMTHKLLEEHENNPNVTSVLNTFNIYVIPVVNVDGYVYTWTSERLWRKNRRKRPGDLCTGVDLNRNWDFDWCELPGASIHQCESVYCGPSPFSESVVKGIADYIQNNTNNIVAFFDFHNYGQMWLSPWGYTTAETKDSQHQMGASAAAVDAVQSMYGTNTIYGTVASALYYVTGSSTDWAYGVANITYSVGVELRDSGKYAFLLPSDQIIPTGKETFQGVLAYIDYINRTMSFDNITSDTILTPFTRTSYDTLSVEISTEDRDQNTLQSSSSAMDVKYPGAFWTHRLNHLILSYCFMSINVYYLYQ